nr:MAG TPA_asm: putative tail fiber protein [Caudoviricetes sp.]
MAIRKGIFKVRNTATGEKDEVMLKTTIEQVADLDKLTGATANAAGVWGLAPAPAKGSQNLPLCGDAKYKVLPVEGGGTGAHTVAAAVQALLGSSAVGSSTKSIYYDGEALKACADSIGGGGIVAALLEQNGYVKFANGLILQWGNAGNKGGSVNVTFPVSFTKTVYQIQLTYNSSNYENPTYAIKDTKSFSYWCKYGGDKLWLAVGV